MGHAVKGSVGCEVCGKSGGQCFEVFLGNEKHIFDSFECATSVMLPKCAHCKRQIAGEVIRMGDKLFCSYTCANDGHVRDFESYVIMQEQDQPRT